MKVQAIDATTHVVAAEKAGFRGSRLGRSGHDAVAGDASASRWDGA